MPYTNDELERLLSEKEADWAERKETWQGTAPEKSRQAICAFANDLPGHGREGVLFVGVSDEGVPTGLEITDRLLQTLASIKTDGQILPPPSLTVEKRVLRGVEVAVVHTRPSNSPPVRYDGRTWIRVGPRRAVATAHEELILSERRLYRDRPFDVRPCTSATLDDLDLRFFSESYLPSAVSRDVLAENGRSAEEQLTSLKLVATLEKAEPTNVGMLVLGKGTDDYIPGAYVEFTRFAGTELTDAIIDSMRVAGRIDEVIERLEEKFAAHNTIAVDLLSSSQEHRHPRYPIAAFQQLFRNAIMHRSYEGTNSPIRVQWFEDRVEIHSPGGPFGAVSEANFGQPGITDYRNPNLAEALRNLGYAQRFGVGIATARKALLENGNGALRFSINPSFTLATMPLS